MFGKKRSFPFFPLIYSILEIFLALRITAILCQVNNKRDWSTRRSESPPSLAVEFHPSKFLIPCYTRDNGGKM